uniref:Uncharacterized protein n=1 Tax=Oryza brachyantha TaxID=4533 RepID=J3L840_ORYBR
MSHIRSAVGSSKQKDDEEEEQDQLWGSRVEISFPEFHRYSEQLLDNVSKLCYPELDEIIEHLARYRIRFYVYSFSPLMFAAESGDELKDPTYYSLDEFREERYFVRYEKDKSLGQYIHPDHIRLAGLSDYHKLVLISVN